jgi:general secretion pathway protein A
MYEDYFGLKKKPFSIVPDPGYFYTSHGHREALAHLLYGITNEGGFVLLTGEVGAGKTTVCRRFLQLVPDDVEVAFILNPKLTSEELLATICDEFRIPYPDGTASVKTFVTRINGYLLDMHEKGRKAVLIIEEAQNLKSEVLEQIRLLTNLETKQRKLLQMIMLGQPELRDMLGDPQLRQLSQRITARYHLGPLAKDEIPAYVEYRLSVAGLLRNRPFPPRTMRKLFGLTGGIPRLINVVCDRALLGAYVQGKEQVDVKTLTGAAREVSGEKGYRPRKVRFYGTMAVALFLVLCAGLGTAYFAPRTWPSWHGAFRGQARQTSISREQTDAAGAAAAGSSEGAEDGASTAGVATLLRQSGGSGVKTREQALAVLFGQWHVGYDAKSGDDVDGQARAQGLRCLSAAGSTGVLRYLNKPAVLTLKDEKGIQYYGALTSLKGDRAVVTVGNETRRVDVKEIAKRWSGDYLLLWREPPAYKETVRLGQSGPVVAWIEERLALAQGKSLPVDRVRTYDRSMAEQVKRFQLVNGMVPDGVVGPRTVIGLGGEVASGDPSLYSGKGGE